MCVHQKYIYSGSHLISLVQFINAIETESILGGYNGNGEVSLLIVQIYT
jgi:hypothetical protein